MQLKLLPPHPLPTVLFTLAYPAPPSNLPLPAAYAALLKLVVEESLLDSETNILERVESPPGAGVGIAGRVGGTPSSPSSGNGTGQGSLTPHALDKATWIAAVLSEVVFDLSGDASAAAGTPVDERETGVSDEDAAVNGMEKGEEARRVRVVCRYVDGREVAWVWDAADAADADDVEGEEGKEAAACYAALQSVLADVNESAAAGERERREREQRHAYHERHAYEAVHPFSAQEHGDERGAAKLEAERESGCAGHGACGGWERYDRYPAPSPPSGSRQDKERETERDAKVSRRHSLGPGGLVQIQRGWTGGGAHGMREGKQRGRRRSFEMDRGRDAAVHVPGAVEVKRGKGKRKEKERKDEKEAKEGVKEGKGKHKKQRSLLMSLVALA
jgi:hypothetical protein